VRDSFQSDVFVIQNSERLPADGLRAWLDVWEKALPDSTMKNMLTTIKYE